MKKICERCGKEANLLSWETKCYKCMKIEALEAVQEAIRTAEPGEEIDTYSSDYVICPYCGEATDASDWGSYDYEIYEDGDHECECGECGNTFVLTTSISYSWETSKKENKNA